MGILMGLCDFCGCIGNSVIVVGVVYRDHACIKHGVNDCQCCSYKHGSYWIVCMAGGFYGDLFYMAICVFMAVPVRYSEVHVVRDTMMKDNILQPAWLVATGRGRKNMFYFL